MHKWLGSEIMHLDRPHLTSVGDMVLGCYGGHTRAGANKNEDGALILCDPGAKWHFAVLCDAHMSSQSAELVLQALESEIALISAALSLPVHTAFAKLHQLIVTLFSSDEFRAQCRSVKGETACLLCAQKEQYLWWLSIGDCVLYLLHPELASLGQYALNQRNFYEWIGQVNTFDLAVPCFSSGVRQLRQGRNHILMVTDGLLEFGDRPFEDARNLYELMMGNLENQNLAQGERVRQLLERVHKEEGQDSATAIYWGYESTFPAAYPSG